MNTKLHAVTDAKGRPISFFMITGQLSDNTGGSASLHSLPDASWILADRGYDADWFREALQDKKTGPTFRGTRRAKFRSNTTSAAKSGASASRSCSAGSRIGGLSQPAKTDVQRPS
jgi:hypothetical protein